MKKLPFQETAKEVFAIEATAINELNDLLDENFNNACELILECTGRLIVVGIGKSGHIGNKIAATFASTGTPSFFVHPGEASHGDLGMITPKDLVMAISYSGETPEILTILPIIKRMGIKLIGITGKPASTLAKLCDTNLNVKVNKEACPMNLAPSASTTATLAMGDALAIAVLNARDFNENDFARSHPGGSLGKRLLLYVEDIMHTEQEVPLISKDEPISSALIEMNSKGLGMTGVHDEKNELCGIFTDGDLRRILSKNIDIHTTAINEVMTQNPVTVRSDILAAELAAMMRQQSINSLFVVNNKKIVGALNMHDLLKAGVL